MTRARLRGYLPASGRGTRRAWRRWGGRFLKEGMRLAVDFLGDEPAVVRVPETVDLEVVTTGEALHAKETSALKQAELENGMKIQVPLFIRPGEVVRVNVETGRYVERVKEKKG